MKRNIILIICLFLIIIFAPSLKEKCKDAQCALHDKKVEHTVTYSNKGSRSEAQHGHLFISGKELPDVFTSVVIERTSYKFYQRKFRWGKDGYYPYNEKEKLILRKSSKKISKEDIDKGWYAGKELLKGTPEDWLYTEWKDGSGFVSPEKIDVMIQELKLKTLPRSTGLQVRVRKE